MLKSQVPYEVKVPVPVPYTVEKKVPYTIKEYVSIKRIPSTFSLEVFLFEFYSYDLFNFKMNRSKYQFMFLNHMKLSKRFHMKLKFQ